MKSEKNILMAFILNFSFSVFEIIGGLLTNSISIISDAIHDAGDALSIGISYFLEKKSRKKPDNFYSYGYTRYSVLGAILTIFILIIGSCFLIYNAINRLFSPVEINYNGMIIFALFGVIVNLIASYFTKDGDSLNQKAVNLHMIEDVLNWVIVLIGALLMKVTDIKIIDSMMSICLAIFILINALKNLKSIIDIFLEKVPNNISIPKIIRKIKEVKSVIDVHHVHIWSIDGITNYATMHIVTEKYSLGLKKEIKELLKGNNVDHVTIEFELENEICGEDSCIIKERKSCGHHHHH